MNYSQSTRNGAEDGADEHTSGEERGGITTRDGVPDIDNDTSAVCQGRAGEHTRQETCDKERGQVVRQRLPQVQKDIADEGDSEDDAASEELRARSPEERADDIATKEDRGDQVADFGARLELRSDVETGGGGGGGGERAEPNMSASRMRWKPHVLTH